MKKPAYAYVHALYYKTSSSFSKRKKFVTRVREEESFVMQINA